MPGRPPTPRISCPRARVSRSSAKRAKRYQRSNPIRRWRGTSTLPLVFNSLDTVNGTRFDGIASGEALVKALLHRSQQTFGVPAGVLFEEEYATFLPASGREGSNFDARMRSAFDGKLLPHRKVGETLFGRRP